MKLKKQTSSNGSVRWINRLGFVQKLIKPNGSVFYQCRKCKKLKLSKGFRPAFVRWMNGGKHLADFLWCRKCINKRCKDNRDQNTKRGREWARKKRKQVLDDPRKYATLIVISIKNRAKNKNLDFDLTVDWVLERLEKGRCEAIGVRFLKRPSRFRKDKRSGFQQIPPRTPTIDRIDNEKGYTKDNCWMVCWFYNRTKANHSHQTVVSFSRKLLENEGFIVSKQ